MNRTTAAVALAAATLLGASPALAQATAAVDSHAIALNRFAPLLAPTDLTVVPAGGTLGHLTIGLGVFVNYERGPLKLFAAGTNDEILGVIASVVKNQVAANFLLGIGITDFAQLTLDLPFTFFQDGTGVDDMGEPAGGLARSSGLGDLKIGARGRAWEGEITDDLVVRAGGGLDLWLPTGDQENFLGERGVVFGGYLDAGLTWNKKLLAALMIGYRARVKPSVLFNVGFGDEILYGVALGYQVLDRLRVSAAWTGYLGGPLKENRGGATPDTMGGDLDQSPMELDGFVDFWLAPDHAVLRWLTLTAGGGAGLRGGVGAPDFRALFGVRYTPDLVALKTAVAGTKGDDEDIGVGPVTSKTYADDDRDGVANRDDLCPKEPEDLDKYDDEDGCPELDNDKDGLPDATDACPNAAEDKDGVEDADGCPDVDDDKDGVFNDVDKCPGPLEDIDGFEDEDGCPDPDNDADGYLDADDKCPDEAEVINGVSDFDGCADEGASRFFVDPDSKKMAALDGLRFAGGTSAELDPSGAALLEELVAQMHYNKWMKKLKLSLSTKGVPAKVAAARVEKVKAELARLGLAADRFSLTAVKKGEEGTLLVEVVP